MAGLTDFFLKNWIFIVIFGNFLMALSNVFSKIIVSGSATRKPVEPTPYTFYTGIFGVFIFLPAIILNFWFKFINFDFASVVGILAGLFLILGLWPFYYVLIKNETSRVMTIFVAAIPLFTFVLKYFFVGERLETVQLLAIIFLVIGGDIVSVRRHKSQGLKVSTMTLAALAGFMIALGLVMAEITFHTQGFISGFVWLVGGYFLASVVLFFWPGQKHKILNVRQYAEKKNIFLFFFEKLLGVSGSESIKYAISLVSATLVNAFEGLKQFFVLIIAAVLSRWYPHILEEELKGSVLWQKILAALLIFAGIFLLVR